MVAGPLAGVLSKTDTKLGHPDSWALRVHGDLANALGFSSPLSLPYAIDELAPLLAERAGSR